MAKNSGKNKVVFVNVKQEATTDFANIGRGTYNVTFITKSKKKFNLNIIGKSLTTQKSYNKKLQLLIKNSGFITLKLSKF